MSDCWPPQTDEDLAACRLGCGIRLHTSAEVVSRRPESIPVTIRVTARRMSDGATAFARVDHPAAKAA